MRKCLRNKLQQNKPKSGLSIFLGFIVLLGMVVLLNIQESSALSRDARMTVNVRVIGTCNISVTAGQALTDKVINSQCNDVSQGVTETDKLDIFGSKQVTESTSDEKDKESSDAKDNGQKQVELGVGREENIRANVKTVKTVLFEG